MEDWSEILFTNRDRTEYSKAERRKAIIGALCDGIPVGNRVDFLHMINYVIDNKSSLFDREEFNTTCLPKAVMWVSSIYNDDKLLDIILPTIKRVYAEVFIKPPSIWFTSKNDSRLTELEAIHKDRYELFVLYFDIDEFINYLIDMLLKCKESLIHFEHLDRTSETLKLIVDNYIANLVNKVQSKSNIRLAIKEIKRDININSILK